MKTVEPTKRNKKIRNILPIHAGDLVECTNSILPEHAMVGIVIDRIHYDKSGEHPDSYSCRVCFDVGERMIRAKWLKVISKNLEKEKNVNHIHYETKI